MPNAAVHQLALPEFHCATLWREHDFNQKDLIVATVCTAHVYSLKALNLLIKVLLIWFTQIETRSSTTLFTPLHKDHNAPAMALSVDTGCKW